MRCKVLQWNVMYSEDPEKVAAFIRKLQPDIVCLQELTLGYHGDARADTGLFFADALAFQGYYDYGAMTLPDGMPAQVGMGVFSRYDIIKRKKVVLMEGVVEAGKIVRDERFYLQASIRLGSSELVVGTTHLPFHPRFQTTPLKQGMVEAILQQIPEGVPYVLAADLNTPPMAKAAKTLRQHDLKNAGPALGLPTWTTKPFVIGPWSYDSLKWRLDYVLYSGSLRRVSSKNVPTELSDHLPILAEFEFL